MSFNEEAICRVDIYVHRFALRSIAFGGHGRSCASLRPRHTVRPVHKCPPYGGSE